MQTPAKHVVVAQRFSVLLARNGLSFLYREVRQQWYRMWRVGNSKNITMQNHLHVTGVTDADSFKRSQHQIFTQMPRGQQSALSRG